MCTGDLVSVVNLDTAQTSAGRDNNFTLNIDRDTVIVLTLSELQENHHYSITIRAGNAAGSALSNTTLSKMHTYAYMSFTTLFNAAMQVPMT